MSRTISISGHHISLRTVKDFLHCVNHSNYVSIDISCDWVKNLRSSMRSNPNEKFLRGNRMIPSEYECYNYKIEHEFYRTEGITNIHFASIFHNNKFLFDCFMIFGNTDYPIDFDEKFYCSS